MQTEKEDAAEFVDEDDKKYMGPAEVGRLFGVDAKTVARWAAKKGLKFKFTKGGHRRYEREYIYDLYDGVIEQSKREMRQE